MQVDAAITRQFDTLIALGDKLLQTRQSRDQRADAVDSQLAAQWGTSALALIDRVYGGESVYAQSWRQHAQYLYLYDHARDARGVLQSARDDWANGWIGRIQHEVEAEMFVDLLAQAEHLLSGGYHIAAAVLAGAVLEDSLRRLCLRHGVPIASSHTIAPMNDALYKSGIYNKVVWAQVSANAQVRNHSAHGQVEQVRKPDVEAMVPYVRRFLGDYHG